MIDYRRVVEYAEPNRDVPTLVEDLCSMGESDVKFTRYVHKYGSALVHAIDGDYLVIALLYYVQTADPSAANKIYIYRQLSAAIVSMPAATPRGAQRGGLMIQPT